MEWARQWMVPTHDTAPTTHLILTGGKLRVSDASHTDFLYAFANAVARGEHPSIVERRTDVFRLFFDLDMHLDDAMPADRGRTLLDGCILSISAMTREWFVAPSHAAIILRKNGDSGDKIGVHLVFESIYVTATTALAFREYIVARLTDAVPDVKWGDLVDPAVFKGSGLRLPWASKRDGTTWYVPRSRVVDDKVEAVDISDTAAHVREWVRKTCIRAPGDVPSHVLQDTQEPTTTSSCTTTSVSLRDLDLGDLPIPETYQPHTATSMHRVGDHALVVRSSSKKCANKGYAEHRSSNVYFVVLKRGIAYQRCYCRKDPVDDQTPCSAFASPPWLIPDAVIARLFPPCPSSSDPETEDITSVPKAAMAYARPPPLPSKKARVSMTTLLNRALAKPKALKGSRRPVM